MFSSELKKRKKKLKKFADKNISEKEMVIEYDIILNIKFITVTIRCFEIISKLEGTHFSGFLLFTNFFILHILYSLTHISDHFR